MHELGAYELMSANDAPERDPMDWYGISEILMFAICKQVRMPIISDWHVPCCF